MSQVTIDLPDNLARALEARPDKNQLVAALLADVLTLNGREDGEDEPLSDEERAALYDDLAAAIAEGDAGLAIPAKEVFAEIRRRWQP